MDKFLKKTTARTKERLLEGIGKAKATQDEVFDQHAGNLSKQAKTGERLQKDIKSYCSALKALCHAEKQLRDTIRETYEAEWPEREHLTALMDNLDIQTNELERAMGEDLVHTASNYVGQFGDLKKKAEKRGRKLIDYDHAKNTYNSLKTSSKKVDSDPKVAKALTELQNAEFCYKEINNELVEILPATYDSRITFVVDTLQHMFNAQSVYNTECSKLNKQVVGQLDKLGQSIDHLRVPRLEPRTLTPIDTNPGGQEDDRASPPSPALAAGAGSARNSVVSANLAPNPAAPVNPPQKVPSAASVNPFDEDESTVPEEEEVCQSKVYPKLDAKKEDAKDTSNPFEESEDESAPPKVAAVVVKTEEIKEEKVVEVKEEKKSEEKKVLYTVLTTHEYKAVDSDELSFGSGEEIKVLDSPDHDQLDEGWKLGEKADGSRGVFPENFTKKK